MSKILSRRLMTLILSYQLRRSLGRLGVPLSPRLAPHPVATDFLRDIAIHRKNGRIQFGLPADPFELVFCRRASVTAYLYLLSHCPAEVELFTGACDDGDYPSGARFTPSSRSARAIAIPDRYFILRDGFRPSAASSRPIRYRGLHAGTHLSGVAASMAMAFIRKVKTTPTIRVSSRGRECACSSDRCPVSMP
ncbi:MAG: hypothetical protein IR164_15590 [Devosia sp.]|uniref:hypothetical protein n=1 Tax=Devosia sp. TaxID=1871048 RepID=UPI0019F36895|nr:hypothetical protein [Devosia sp.]MBF0680349.1 hypothetical protein [Devosia sp.]